MGVKRIVKWGMVKKIKRKKKKRKEKLNKVSHNKWQDFFLIKIKVEWSPTPLGPIHLDSSIFFSYPSVTM